MFFNLAWRNSKRNRSENLIYFLTMVTAVATFYIVLSLGSQDVMRFLEEIESDAVNRLLTMLMPTVYLFSLLFVFFLVIFANKYQLECRSRELGLYLMFGMTKRHLFIQIMAEGLITSLLALLGGLICGGFLSEVISLATARLVGRGIIAHQSSFSVSAVLLTTLGFLMIQVVALFILCGKLFNKEIHQLLYGEMAKKQQVGKMSGNLFSLILGAVVLTLAYWVILKYFMVAGGMMIIVAVILAELAEKYNCKMSQIAIAWQWAKGILSPIIGATKTQYLDDSAGAFDIKLTAEDLAYLEEPYVPHEIVGAIDKNPAQGVILLDEKK